MRTRGFENTLREREAEASGARCRTEGFCSDTLPLCFCPPVPAGLSGEWLARIRPGPPGARDGAPGRRPPVRGPGGQGRLGLVCDPGGPGCGTPAELGLDAELSSAGAGACGREAPQVTGRVPAVSVGGTFGLVYVDWAPPPRLWSGLRSTGVEETSFSKPMGSKLPDTRGRRLGVGMSSGLLICPLAVQVWRVKCSVPSRTGSVELPM